MLFLCTALRAFCFSDNIGRERFRNIPFGFQPPELATLGFHRRSSSLWAGSMLAIAILSCLSADLLAQQSIAQQSRSNSGVSNRTTAKMAAKKIAEMTADTSEKPFEDQFWKYLIGNNYKNWSPGPGTSGDFYTGQNPHGALLKMYLNRTAAGRISNFPMGSVIILENYRADKSLKTISVMYRTDGFHPQGNDWYWIEYHPDGTVVKAPVESFSQRRNVGTGEGAEGAEGGLLDAGDRDGHLKKTMGRATNCIACHQNGNGADLVFFNDREFNIAQRADQRANQDRMADNGPPSGPR